MFSQRDLMRGAAAVTAAVTAAAVSKEAMAALPELVTQTKPDTMLPLVPSTGAGPTTRSSRWSDHGCQERAGEPFKGRSRSAGLQAQGLLGALSGYYEAGMKGQVVVAGVASAAKADGHAEHKH